MNMFSVIPARVEVNNFQARVGRSM